MTIGANSYGSVLGVAALVPRWTNSGTGDSATFSSTSRPTITQVETFIDEVSAALNSMLAQSGFTIPVSDADAVKLLDLFVNVEVSTMCDGVNGSGRFGPSEKSSGGRGRFSLLMDDIQAFITANETGLRNLGAARDYTVLAGFPFWDVV